MIAKIFRKIEERGWQGLVGAGQVDGEGINGAPSAGRDSCWYIHMVWISVAMYYGVVTYFLLTLEILVKAFVLASNSA